MKLFFHILGLLWASLFSLNSQSAQVERNMGMFNQLDQNIVTKITNLCSAKDRVALRSTCKELAIHLQKNKQDDFIKIHQLEITNRRKDFTKTYHECSLALRLSSIKFMNFWYLLVLSSSGCCLMAGNFLSCLSKFLPTNKLLSSFAPSQKSLRYGLGAIIVGLLATPLITGTYAGLSALISKKHIVAKAQKCYYPNDASLRINLKVAKTSLRHIYCKNYYLNLLVGANPLIKLSGMASSWAIEKILFRSLRIN